MGVDKVACQDGFFNRYANGCFAEHHLLGSRVVVCFTPALTTVLV